MSPPPLDDLQGSLRSPTTTTVQPPFSSASSENEDDLAQHESVVEVRDMFTIQDISSVYLQAGKVWGQIADRMHHKYCALRGSAVRTSSVVQLQSEEGGREKLHDLMGSTEDGKATEDVGKPTGREGAPVVSSGPGAGGSSPAADHHVVGPQTSGYASDVSEAGTSGLESAVSEGTSVDGAETSLRRRLPARQTPELVEEFESSTNAGAVVPPSSPMEAHDEPEQQDPPPTQSLSQRLRRATFSLTESLHEMTPFPQKLAPDFLEDLPDISTDPEYKTARAHQHASHVVAHISSELARNFEFRNLRAPHVPVTAIYGSGLNTQYQYRFDNGLTAHPTRIFFCSGDGTVTDESLGMCRFWAGENYLDNGEWKAAPSGEEYRRVLGIAREQSGGGLLGERDPPPPPTRKGSEADADRARRGTAEADFARKIAQLKMTQPLQIKRLEGNEHQATLYSKLTADSVRETVDEVNRRLDRESR